MKDYLLFNACRKKANWRRAILFTYQSMNRRQFILFIVSLSIGCAFMSISLWKDLGYAMVILDFIGFDRSTSLSGSWSVGRLFGNNLLQMFAAGEVVIILTLVAAYNCMQTRIRPVMDVFDSKVRGELIKFRFIKFLMFIRACDEFKILNERQLRNALKCCEKELFSNNYSSFSSNPIFLIFIAFLSAFLSLSLENLQTILWQVFIIVISLLVVLYSFIGGEISTSREFFKTKQLCEWIEYFDNGELDMFVDIMNKHN